MWRNCRVCITLMCVGGNHFVAELRSFCIPVVYYVTCVLWLCITLLVYSGGCIALRWAIIQPTRREQSALSDADRGSTASWNRARGHLLHLLVHLLLHLLVHLLVHLLLHLLVQLVLVHLLYHLLVQLVIQVLTLIYLLV